MFHMRIHSFGSTCVNGQRHGLGREKSPEVMMIIGKWSPSPHGLENQSVNERRYQVEHFDNNILILSVYS